MVDVYGSALAEGYAYSAAGPTLLPIAILPVTYLNFDAKYNNAKAVSLSWSTATEINAQEYIVEKSTDGYAFTDIGSVPAHGNSTSQQNYTYTDAAANSGNVFYRLKQIDYNGQPTYSKMISLNTNTHQNTIGLSPNPLPTGASSLAIQYSTTEEATAIISIKNIIGQESI